MSKRTKYTAEEKYEILKLSENGIGSLQEFLTKYRLSKHAFYVWKYNYSKYGIDGLTDSRTWKKYSKELKELAVRDYISGGFSLREVVNKYEITGKAVLQKWVKRKESVLEIENKMLMTEIIKIYEEVDGIYGYRRMMMNLNRKFTADKLNQKWLTAVQVR